MSGRRPEGTDESSAPRRVAPDASVELDGDEVLYVADPPRLYTLNPTARIVWHSLDGDVSVDQLAEELAQEFGVPLDAMRADVVGLVRELGRAGLLVGVEADPEAVARYGVRGGRSSGARDRGTT